MSIDKKLIMHNIFNGLTTLVIFPINNNFIEGNKLLMDILCYKYEICILPIEKL